MRKPIILDTDPGIGTPGSDVDDGLAIALGLLHPACQLLGLTIVAGNVPHEDGLPNALRLLEIACRRDVPRAQRCFDLGVAYALSLKRMPPSLDRT